MSMASPFHAMANVQILKCWLQTSIEGGKKAREIVRNTLQEKCDSVISKPIEVATNLLNNPNASVGDLDAANHELLSCNNFMWSLLMTVCEMIKKHQSDTSQMCSVCNYPQQGAYLSGIPATSLNYVQVQSQSGLEECRSASVVEREGIVDRGNLKSSIRSGDRSKLNSLTENTSREGKVHESSIGVTNATVACSSMMNASNNDNVPQPDYNIAETESNDFRNNTESLMMSESDSAPIAYSFHSSVNQETISESSFGNNKREGPVPYSKQGSLTPSRISRCSKSNKAETDRLFADQSENHGKNIVGLVSNQYESDMCESISVCSTSIQESPVASSRRSHSRHDESGRDNVLTKSESAFRNQNNNSSTGIADSVVTKVAIGHADVVSLCELKLPVESDLHESHEQIDKSVSSLPAVPIANAQRSPTLVYQSDLESGTDTANLSFNTANLSPCTQPSQADIDNSVVKDHHKTTSCETSSETTYSTAWLNSIATSNHPQEVLDFDGYSGLVSDVATPSSFSIQRKSHLKDLQILGRTLNTIYQNPNQIDQRFHMQEAPKEGDVIAVKFAVDGNWYRGQVLQITGLDNIIVQFIDYGNTDEILWKNAFKLASLYRDIPPMSTRCSLAGIKPSKSEKGDGDGKRTWGMHAMKWFDEAWYGKTVSIIPVYKTKQLLYVQLFTDREVSGKSECISDVMVESGFAQYDVSDDESVPELHEDNQPIQSMQIDNTVSKAYSEQSIANIDDCKNGDNQECASAGLAPCSTGTASGTNMSENDRTHHAAPDDLGTWNPLAEDFKSAENSYGINNENACVMVEGYDPEKIKLCKYYMKAQCWKGDKCPYLHQAPTKNGEVAVQLPTFSASDIPTMPLREGDLCIGRVTHVDRGKNFYIHVIKYLGNKDECSTIKTKGLMDCNISEELNSLSNDMRCYCNGGKRNIRNRSQPAIGEAYIVYCMEDNCYHRGMIIESHGLTEANRYQHFTVHLIDLGKNIVVHNGSLHPIAPMFMHLPRQAKLCTLLQFDPAKQMLMEKIAKSSNSSNFVIEIMQTCDAAGGPEVVALYNIDANRLKKFL